MSMAAGLYTLPAELLDQIIDHLHQPVNALPRLLQCNKALKQYIEPLLWARDDVRRRAMRWGCITGGTVAIRLAVSYGAPINFIALPRDPDATMSRRDVRPVAGTSMGFDQPRLSPGILTVYLAIKHRKIEALKLLLELGARIYPVPQLGKKLHKQQLKHLVERICASVKEHPGLALCYFNFGLDLQIKDSGFHSCAVYHPLVRLIDSGAPVEVVRTCLDHGANPGQMQSSTLTRFWRDAVTPISAAALAGSSATIHLLVERGADIRGTKSSVEDLGDRTERAMHIPVFAAAYALATKHHGLATMQACLDNGSDINQHVQAPFMHPYYDHVNERGPYMASPVHLFLDSIESWNEDESLPDPVEGLKYLLDRGANVMWTQLDARTQENQKQSGSHAIPVSALVLIVRKWSTDTFMQRRCQEVVELLVNHGAADRDIALLLKKLTVSRNPDHLPFPDFPGQVKGRKTLVEILLDRLASRCTSTEVSRVLFEFIMAIGKDAHTLSDDTTDIVDRLIAIGADINAPFLRLSRSKVAMPVLHTVCEDYNSRALLGSGTSRHDGPHPASCSIYVLRFLVSRGADHDIPVGRQNAIDLVLDGCERLDLERKGYLLKIADTLEGGENGQEIVVFRPRIEWEIKCKVSTGTDDESDRPC